MPPVHKICTVVAGRPTREFSSDRLLDVFSSERHVSWRQYRRASSALRHGDVRGGRRNGSSCRRRLLTEQAEEVQHRVWKDLPRMGDPGALCVVARAQYFPASQSVGACLFCRLPLVANRKLPSPKSHGATRVSCPVGSSLPTRASHPYVFFYKTRPTGCAMTDKKKKADKKDPKTVRVCSGTVQQTRYQVPVVSCMACLFITSS